MDNGSTREISTADIVMARRGLHAVAEQVLAGPQWRATGHITLSVTPDGFITNHGAGPGIDALRVSGSDLIREPDGLRVPLTGTLAELSGRIGVQLEAPVTVYPQASVLGPGDQVDLTGPAAKVVLNALADGAAALRRFASLCSEPAEPILWPEHFDAGIIMHEVNYGVSPGDAGHDLPYAYVGPWVARTGDFWNETFGASIPMPLSGTIDQVVAFFAEGMRRAGAHGVLAP
jgi:hypothetical protein